MRNEQLPLESPEAPRFPLRGIPMAEMAVQLWNEGGWSGRLIR